MHGKTTWRAIVSTALLLIGIGVAAAPAAAADQPAIVEFWLIDADTDTPIVQLDDYDTLRLPMLPAKLSVEAVANPETESVRMEIDHVLSSTENHAPYALRGDNSGDFNPAPELRTPGWITISARPYAGADLGGEAGVEVHLHLYLHQPDFVVRSSVDKGDYDPGDGWCTVGPPPKVIDDYKVVAQAELFPWEDRLRTLALKSESRGVDPARAEGLQPTVEIDRRRSSPALIEVAKPMNEAARQQIAQRGLRRSVEIDPGLVELDLDLAADGRKGSPDDRKSAPVAEKAGGVDLGLTTTWIDPSLFELDIDDLVTWLPANSCTLRAAIEEANALPGKQSVLIDSSKGPFKLFHGQLDVTDAIDLIGHGARAVIDAQDDSRIFYLAGDHIMNLHALELINGDPTKFFDGARGGAMWIDDEAYVQMSDSVIRDSRANFGGGIYIQADSDLVLSSSAVRNNIGGTPDDGINGGGQTQRGGGISNVDSRLTVRHSSISDNLAVRGAGISNFGGTVRVENSSIIDNEALAIGGGIENHTNFGETGVVHLSFATVAHNQAGTAVEPPANQRVGGGIYNASTAFIASSILAANTDAYGAGDPLHAPDCHSPTAYGFTSYRHNVVGVLNGNCELADYSWGTTAWIDHGTEGSPLDPELGFKSVWDHRYYRMISASSPALDGGASQAASLYPCPDHDSRDRNRPVGGGCDIGAVERQ